MLSRGSTVAGYTACYTRFWEENPLLSGYGCAASATVQTVYTTNSLGIGQRAPGSTFGLVEATNVETTTNQAAASSALSATTTTINAPGSSSPKGGSGGSGLNTADKIALGVGIPIPFLTLVFGILAWWEVRRRKKRKGETSRSNTMELT